MGIDEQKGDATSKLTRVIRPEFRVSQGRRTLKGEPGTVIPFKRKQDLTTTGMAESRHSDPELLLVRLNGAVRYDLLLQGLRAAGLVLKQDRDGLLITQMRAQSSS